MRCKKKIKQITKKKILSIVIAFVIMILDHVNQHSYLFYTQIGLSMALALGF